MMFLSNHSNAIRFRSASMSALAFAFCGVISLLAAIPLNAVVGPLSTIKVGKQPAQVASNPPAHLVYVINQGDNTVSAIDTELLTVKKVISVGNGPAAIAANPAANAAYVANSGSGTITAITGTTPATWTVGGTPTALVVDSALSQLYVMDASRNQIEIVSTIKGTVLATILTTLQPSAMGLNIATHGLFVACTGASGSVVVIDGTHNQILTTVTGIAPGTTSISLSPQTNVAVLVSPTQNLYTVIDADNGYAITTEGGTSGADPLATAYDPAGLFFEMDNGDGHVFFSDDSGIITLGNDYTTDLLGASAIAINPTTNQMGVVYGDAEAIYIIDLLNPLFPQNYFELNTGHMPTGIAFDPSTNRAFVTDQGDNTVSVYDITPSLAVGAYEGSFGGNSVSYNYTDTNPATATVYTVRLGNVYAISEAAAGKGFTGLSGDAAGVTTIPIASPYSQCVAVNAATNKIYVGDTSGFFYSINGSSNVATVISSVPSTADIRAVTIDPASDLVIAWDYGLNKIYVLDSATDSLLKTIAVTSGSNGTLQVDPIKNLVYFAISNSVFVIDPVAGTIVNTIPVPQTVLVSAINPALSRLYTASNSKDVVVINTTNNSVVTDFQLPQAPLSMVVNPVSGNYYIGFNDAGDVTRIYEYSGSTNAFLMDFDSTTFPDITGAVSLAVNPLTDTIYAGDGSGNNPIASIDGRTGAVAQLIGSGYDTAAQTLAVDLGNNLLAAAGYSYTTLYFPTSDATGAQAVPISMSLKGVKDSQTIATTPLFRTHNTQPSFTITATSNFAKNAPALVPRHVFLALDGWQTTWLAEPLTPKNGTNTSSVSGKVPAKLSTGRHIIYAYASDGDIATVQNSAVGGNSPVISPIGSVVFTVEK